MKHQIKYLPLDEVMAAPRNPKDHDLGAIMLSIRRFGFVTPAVINAASGRLVAGHGRLEALLSMRDEGEPAPNGVIVDESGRWLMPVVTGVEFVSEEEAEAYLVADNRTPQLGGWDEAMLAEVLRDQTELAGTGYDGDDLDAMLESLDPADLKVPDPTDLKTKPADERVLVEIRCTREVLAEIEPALAELERDHDLEVSISA